MPKKHSPAYTTAKPQYVHPSLQSSRSSASSTPAEPQSVNQRIAQLRREQAPRPTIEQRNELASVVSSRTVPPALRRILAIPEVNAPKPKAGTGLRARGQGGRRPPPGPAAPVSWLERSRYAPKPARDFKRSNPDERTAPTFGHLARVTEIDLKRLFPPPRSLQDLCLRTFAVHWAELSEYEQHYLPTLPVRVREALLSYLTVYAEEGSLSFKSFKILFQNDAEGTQGGEDVQFLDLTRLLGKNFTIQDLTKCLKRQLPQSQMTGSLSAMRISDTATNGKSTATVEVADSWEEEVDDDAPEIIETAEPLAMLTTPHFSNLTRLSLARVGASASWPDLIKLSPNLNKITHLSLAYWPRPTLTPNSTSTSMVSGHTRHSLGGTHTYSDLDNDWHEATNILRRFSYNTYSLQWLDLEGCTWNKALTWRDHFERSFIRDYTPAPMPSQTPDQWQGHPSLRGPDWNDAWQSVKYINLFQGWIPSEMRSLQAMPAGRVPLQLMKWLRENAENEEERWKLRQESGCVVEEWIEKEKVAQSVGTEILARRKEKGGRWCKMDYGWGFAGMEKAL